MTPRLLTSVVTLFLALAGPLQADVIGEDGRRVAGTGEAALASAVGYLTCSRVVDGRLRFSRGTATVVGSRRTILTAAHVLVDEAGRRGRRVVFDVPTDCIFRLNDGLGDPAVEVGIARAAIGAFRDNAGVPNEDWAVLTTSEPLPETVLPLRFGNLDPLDMTAEMRVPIGILAFHADVRQARRTPLYSEGELFGVDYAGLRRLAHTADTGRMSSGAAIVHRTSDGLDVVIAVNRSGANFGEFNLAVPLTGELEGALRSSAYGELPLSREPLARLR